MATASCSGPFLRTRNSKTANSLVLRACLYDPQTEAPVDYNLRMERLLFRPGWVEGVWRPLGAFGGLWEPLGASGQKDRKYDLQNGGVDYSPRMERLLFRFGWAEGLLKPLFFF